MKKRGFFLIIFSLVITIMNCTGIKNSSSSSSIPFKNIYYVSPDGNDNNTGSINSSFLTVTKAISLIFPGDLIFVRGGNYKSTKITLNKTGKSGAEYYIFAYPGERPVFDFTGTTSYGIYITGNYWHIKGLEIMNAGNAGIRITGNYNIIENCVTHNNNDAGLYIGINKGTDVNTDGSLAAYNEIINCDSYLNYDSAGSTGPGGNADGFACKLNAGKGNVFRGCRSWENSDDGWDLYLTNFAVTMENCWTWHNGDPASYGYNGSSWGGNGNGFKVGVGSSSKTNEYVSHASHILKNCIAFDMNYGNTTNVNAFDRNNNMSGVIMYNCLAFNSKTGFGFGTAPDDGTHHILKNCVSFNCSINNIKLSGDTIQSNNSWNFLSDINVSTSDFLSLDLNLAKAARNTDGSLPDNDFAKLTSNSTLIDRGVDVGLHYLGSAPDLGAFEKK
jgi:pectate disaccharide-lyase